MWIQLPFKITYKFKDDDKLYTCNVTHDQYKNFGNLPNIEKCNTVKGNTKNYQEYKDEMQEAINLAVKNNTTHIRKLSEIVEW